jgi:hypothetical protein
VDNWWKTTAANFIHSLPTGHRHFMRPVIAPDRQLNQLIIKDIIVLSTGP